METVLPAVEWGVLNAGQPGKSQVGNFYVVFYFTTINTFFFQRKETPSLLPHPPQWTWVAPSQLGPPHPRATLHWPPASSCPAPCPGALPTGRASEFLFLDLLFYPLTTLTHVTLQLPEDLPAGCSFLLLPPTPQLPLSPT